jgi:serine/threonine protein kinase
MALCWCWPCSLADAGINYRAILDTALDVAKAMLHLHSLNVLHADLKARNVMLKSGGEGRTVVAKVADFGLSVKMDVMETHISSVFQVCAWGLRPGGQLFQCLSPHHWDVYYGRGRCGHLVISSVTVCWLGRPPCRAP